MTRVIYLHFRFIPAYKDGNKPYGEWAACQLFVEPKWFDERDRRYDLGAIKACDRASDGARLHDVVVGSIGFAADLPRNHRL